jgi:hypothetical protein
MRATNPRLIAVAKQLAATLNSLSEGGASSGHMDSRRLDADETNMLALALEDMRTKVFEAEYPELKARSVLAVDSDVDPGADVFSYEEEDWFGDVKIISDNGYAQDLPSVETKARKITHTIVSIGNGYTYSIQDLRRAAFSGRPLEARKAIAQRQKFEMGQDKIAALGSGEGSTGRIPYGLLNRPVGTSAGQVRSTAVTNTSWDATPVALEMVAQLNTAVAEFVTDSAELYEPGTLILPVHSFLRLSHAITADNKPESAAQRFLSTNGFVKRIIPWNLLKGVDGVGAASTADDSRGLLMSGQPDVASLVIPQEFEVFAPQQENLAFKVLAHGRTAGTCVYKPLGLRYLTGLPSA